MVLVRPDRVYGRVGWELWAAIACFSFNSLKLTSFFIHTLSPFEYSFMFIDMSDFSLHSSSFLTSLLLFFPIYMCVCQFVALCLSASSFGKGA